MVGVKKKVKKFFRKTKKTLRKGNAFGQRINNNLKDYFDEDLDNARNFSVT